MLLNTVKIQFSQKQFQKSPLAEEVKRLIQFCLPKAKRYRQGLLVKVLFYTGEGYQTYWRGHYANGYAHGLYGRDWDAGANSVITLKIGQQVGYDKILYLVAHEVSHHISWIKDQRFGEKKADKIAAKIIERYNQRH